MPLSLSLLPYNQPHAITSRFLLSIIYNNANLLSSHNRKNPPPLFFFFIWNQKIKEYWAKQIVKQQSILF